MYDTTLVLQGNLGETSLDELLSTLSLSRSCLRVEVDPGDGSIIVKSGNVLKAEAGASQAPGRSAFEALRRQQHGSFRVYRQPYEARSHQPIGSLSELMDTPIAGEAEDARDLVLSGIADHDALKDVLGMMGLSRRRLELRMRREDGTEAVVLAKAGLVCDARIEPSGLTGREALLDMRRVGVVSFELYHLRTTDRLPRPFGSLVELVRDRRRRGGTVRDRDHHSVIRGRFDEHSFLDVLSIVTASRQVLEINLTRRRAWRGTLLVKSSQLLSASCDTGETGVEALLALLADPGDGFDAVLANRTALPDAPLGDLRQITAIAAQGEQPRDEVEPVVEPVVRPRPKVVPPLSKASPASKVGRHLRPRPEPLPAAKVTEDSLGGFPDPTLVPTPRPAMPRVPRPASSPAPQDLPQARLTEPSVDLTPLEDSLERLQRQLSRQEDLLRDAAHSTPPQGPASGLLVGVLVAQLLVAGLLVAVVTMLAIG